MHSPKDISPKPSLSNEEGAGTRKAYSSLDPKDVINSFPFPSFREHQKEKIEEIVEAFNSGYKWILLETPTGFGKSPVNVAFCRNIHSFYITPQNMLIDQLNRDFPDLTLIKGRRHYPCVQNPAFMCHDGPCKRTSDYKCPEKYERCTYWTEKINAIQAQTALTNFAYFTGEGRIKVASVPILGRRPLTVIDEGHSIDKHVLNQISTTVSASTVPQRVFKQIKPELYKLPERLDGEQIDALLRNVAERCVEFISSLPTRLDDYQLKQVKRGQDFIQKFGSYFENQGADWVGHTKIKRYTRGEWIEVVIQPIYVNGFMEEHLWRRSDRFIISSATLFVNDFIKECGLTDHADKIWHTQAPSTFPIPNRMIVDASTGSLSWKKREENLPGVMENIKKILAVEPGKGIIHAHSYAFSDALRRINDPRLLFHESMNREDMLNKFLDSPPETGTVFVAVAMTEGLDLYGDLATFQILLKCPYPNFMDDLRVNRRLIQLKHNRWYAVQTMKVIVQAYGRAVRSPTDKANFYVMDSDVKRVCSKWKRHLPKFYVDAYNQRRVLQ